MTKTGKTERPDFVSRFFERENEQATQILYPGIGTRNEKGGGTQQWQIQGEADLTPC